MQKSRIFEKHRVLGLYCNEVPGAVRFVGPLKSNLLSCAVGNVLHTYDCANLRLMAISDAHPSPIQCIAADEHLVYTGCGKEIRSHHNNRHMRKIYSGHESDVKFLLPFGGLLVSVDASSCVKVWLVDSGELQLELELDPETFQVSAICHPATYLNKILLGSAQGELKLYNVKTSALLHTFSHNWDSRVSVLQQSTVIDIVAVGFANGKVLLLNLRFDEVLLSLQTAEPSELTSVTFRTDLVKGDQSASLMLTGNCRGEISVWDLNKQRQCGQIRTGGPVGTLVALPNEPIVLTAGGENAIRTWIFDRGDEVTPRLLCQLEGHTKGPPTVAKFYGEADSYSGKTGDFQVLSAGGGDSKIRSFSVQKANKQQSFGEATKLSRKKVAKLKSQRDLVAVEEAKFPPITTLSFESARESRWDNLACCHDGSPTVTTWSTRLKRLGSHRLCHNRFASDPYRLAVALSCCVSPCGNFVLIGYSSGHVDKFNIQSGMYRGSCQDELNTRKDDRKAHNAPVRGVVVDSLSVKCVSGCGDGWLKFWRFKKLTLAGKLKLSSGVGRIVIHSENDLIAVGLDDFSLVLVELQCGRVARRFPDAHMAPILDLTFNTNGEWLISCSLDSTLKVWDLPSGTLVDVLMVSDVCTSVSLSANGEYLATTHVGQLGVYLWCNRTIFVPHLMLKPLPIDFEPTLVVDIGNILTIVDEIQVESEEETVENPEESGEVRLYCSPEQISSQLLTVSNLPRSHWANLLMLDLIKRRNRPKEPPKKPQSAPFFLPTVAGLETQFDLSAAQGDNSGEGEKSRLLKLSQLEPLGKFAKLVETGEMTKAWEMLKSFGPSAIDMEVRSLGPFGGGNVALMTSFLQLIQWRLKSHRDFELCQSYLGLFLKHHRETLWANEEFADVLSSILKEIQSGWNSVDHMATQSACLLQYLKCATL